MGGGKVMKEFRVKDLLIIKNGRDHKHLNKGNIPVYGSGGVLRYVNQYLYDRPSILLPRKGTLDNIQYCEEPFWCVDTTYYSEVNEELANPYYLYRYLNLLDLRNLDSGTALPSMTFDSYYQIKVLLPPIEKQNSIAKVLYNIDQKIALNTRMNAELEAMAKQLYDYWFVQFDFPDENGKPYKSSGGKMVYNETLKRDMPERWEVKLLTDVLGEKKSGDWGQDKEQGIYTLKVNCIRGADLKDPLNAPKRFINQKNSNRLLDANDIIVEISGGSPVQATGRSLYVTEGLLDRYNKKLTCSNFCQAIKVLDNELSSYFYYTWNLFYDNNIMFNFEGKTSGIKNLLIDMLLGTSWYFPPVSIYKKFDSLIQRLFKQIDSNKIENQELTHLRDSLLPMLMNGQVIVE